MGSFFNKNISPDSELFPINEKFFYDYGKAIPDADNYEVSCYIEEYTTEKGLCARIRDKMTNKRVCFWFSPYDVGCYEWKNDYLKYLSDIKRLNNLEYYKRDGEAWIQLSAILLKESDDEILVSSYFAEFLFAGKIFGDM